MALAQEIYRSEATRGMQCVGRISDSVMRGTGQHAPSGLAFPRRNVGTIQYDYRRLRPTECILQAKGRAARAFSGVRVKRTRPLMARGTSNLSLCLKRHFIRGFP